MSRFCTLALSSLKLSLLGDFARALCEDSLNPVVCLEMFCVGLNSSPVDGFEVDEGVERVKSSPVVRLPVLGVGAGPEGRGDIDPVLPGVSELSRLSSDIDMGLLVVAFSAYPTLSFETGFIHRRTDVDGPAEPFAPAFAPTSVTAT
jgi:hypothetical protein